MVGRRGVKSNLNLYLSVCELGMEKKIKYSNSANDLLVEA